MSGIFSSLKNICHRDQQKGSQFVVEIVKVMLENSFSKLLTYAVLFISCVFCKSMLKSVQSFRGKNLELVMPLDWWIGTFTRTVGE